MDYSDLALAVAGSTAKSSPIMNGVAITIRGVITATFTVWTTHTFFFNKMITRRFRPWE